MQSKNYVYLGYHQLVEDLPKRHVYTEVARECAFLRGQAPETRNAAELLKDHSLATEFPLCDADPGDIVFGKPPTQRALRMGRRSGWAKVITQIRPLALYKELNGDASQLTDNCTETIDRLKFFFNQIPQELHGEFLASLCHELIEGYKQRPKPKPNL